MSSIMNINNIQESIIDSWEDEVVEVSSEVVLQNKIAEDIRQEEELARQMKEVSHIVIPFGVKKTERDIDLKNSKRRREVSCSVERRE